MFQFAFAAVAATKLAAPVSAPNEHVFVSADQLKWVPAPPAFPRGAEMAVVAGDPSKKGMYVIRLKAPAGYKVPPHSHPLDENITVISGSLIYEMGDKVDEKKTALKPGGFARMPKGTVHYDIFPEDTIIQVHGQGPQGITFVTAVDDPRRAR